MTKIKSLLDDIEELRKNLIRLLEKSDWNLLDEKILTASQNFDEAIVKYNELLLKKNRDTST